MFFFCTVFAVFKDVFLAMSKRAIPYLFLYIFSVQYVMLCCKLVKPTKKFYVNISLFLTFLLLRFYFVFYKANYKVLRLTMFCKYTLDVF